jgi:hypothetical protein
MSVKKYLVYEGAAVEAGDLTAPYIRHLEVRMQQQIEAECQVFAGIINANVEVEFFLT